MPAFPETLIISGRMFQHPRHDLTWCEGHYTMVTTWFGEGGSRLIEYREARAKVRPNSWSIPAQVDYTVDVKPYRQVLA